MTHGIDSYRFQSGITKRMAKTWIGMEKPRPIPWTPLRKPLADCTVALVSSAGMALTGDRPFDQESERQNPWWGDPSYRVLPATTVTGDARLYHLHIDPAPATEDMNCLFPIERLNELAQAGVIGRAAPRHCSIMGYILEPAELIQGTAPAIIGHLREDGVDVVLLAPA